MYMQLIKLFFSIKMLSLTRGIFLFHNHNNNVVIRNGKKICCSGYRWNTTTNVCDGKKIKMTIKRL